MKSMEIKPYNLPKDRILLSSIDAKPEGVFVAIMLVGVLSIIGKISNVFGLIMIVFGLGLFIFMPKVVLMEFYSNYLVLFNKADKDNCYLIYYEDIEAWYYSWGASKDFLHIKLIDGKEINLESFSKTKFERKMNRFLKDKHKKYR